jgi:hypothetical protein
VARIRAAPRTTALTRSEFTAHHPTWASRKDELLGDTGEDDHARRRLSQGWRYGRLRRDKDHSNRPLRTGGAAPNRPGKVEGSTRGESGVAPWMTSGRTPSSDRRRGHPDTAAGALCRRDLVPRQAQSDQWDGPALQGTQRGGSQPRSTRNRRHRAGTTSGPHRPSCGTRDGASVAVRGRALLDDVRGAPMLAARRSPRLGE